MLQDLTSGALTKVDDGAHEVDSGSDQEDRKPASVGLGNEFGGQRAARDARDRRLPNSTYRHICNWSVVYVLFLL